MAPQITSADQVLELISSIKADTIYLSQVSIANNRRKRQLDLSENYDKLTPSGKTKAIADLGPSAQGVTKFLDSQARINILRGAQGPLRFVASDITRYVKFRSAVKTTPFPSTPLTVRRWIATFNCGKTFGLHVNHVKKASPLLGRCASWHDPEIRAIANGLANAQDRSIAFPNFVMPQDIMRILDWETWGCAHRADRLPILPLRHPGSIRNHEATSSLYIRAASETHTSTGETPNKYQKDGMYGSNGNRIPIP